MGDNNIFGYYIGFGGGGGSGGSTSGGGGIFNVKNVGRGGGSGASGNYHYQVEENGVLDDVNYYTSKNIIDSIDLDKLWEKMYSNAKKMWVSCEYCNSVNAIGNSNCVSCNAGLGDFYNKKENKKCQSR